MKKVIVFLYENLTIEDFVDSSCLPDISTTMFDTHKMQSSDRILFPIHYNEDHWTMIEADFKNSTLIHYDGKSGYKHNIYCILVACLLETYYSKTNHVRKSLKFMRWKMINSDNFPVQINGDDCGVFLIHGAACIAFNNSKFNWTKDDINYLRKYYAGALLALKNEEEFHFAIMFQKDTPTTPSKVPLLLKVKVCTPEKRNAKAAIYHQLPANYNELAKQLQEYSWPQLMAWSLLTQIATSTGTHVDYQKQVQWVLENIDDWPQCTLEKIPHLKKEYLLIVMNWDFCLATGHARTDFGMALTCITLKCCSRKCPCTLVLMHNYSRQLNQWKSMTVDQRDAFIENKMYRAYADINEAGQFTVTDERTLCVRSWQALYGVHSARINSVYSKDYSVLVKTAKWAKAVHQVTPAQTQELDNHLESVLLPNPFAPRGLNERTHVCPPEIRSFHQLYLHYAWEHIRKCPTYV